MTKAEWAQVQTGDFLVERRTGIRRRVLSLSRSATGRVTFALVKLVRQRWTPGPLTVYSSNDDIRGERWSWLPATRKP